MAKRRYGSGAVKLRSDGRWEGQFRLADGSRRSVYAHSREEVVARLQEERWRLISGIPVRSKGLLVGVYLQQWLDVARTRLRPRTIDAYELCIRRIDGELGHLPLARLSPQLVQRAYGRLLAGGLSVPTVFQTHAVLHCALRQAHHWGLMALDPTALVEAPRPRTREMTALSAAQLSHLLASARGSRWYPLWALLGTTWLRIGEALGLRWSDVDLDRGRLQVRRAL